ncbi:hypothetical protein NXY00_24090 [Bacteroides sp. BFG-551]|nr:hypothetical protein [Bacteroides sp. BFG-551]
MNNHFTHVSIVLFFLCLIGSVCGYAQTSATTDTGYQLWLNYKPVPDTRLKRTYVQYYSQIRLSGSRYDEVIADELKRSLKAMLTITPNSFIMRKKAFK